MADVIIAADVGGSKTTVAVQVDGVEAARVTAAGAAARPGRVLASSATIIAAVRQALATAGQLQGRLLVVGAAGAGREPEASELARALRAEGVADTVRVTTDLALALAAAFRDAPGLVLSAGTGSVAVARTADGTVMRLGGHGWQLGDAGSGYDLGRQLLRQASLAADGLAPDSTLLDATLAATRSGSIDDLVRWAAGAGPREVASLARLAIDEAGSGNAAARQIVGDAAEQLAALAMALAARSKVTEAALTGGMMKPGALRDAVRARLTGHGLKVRDAEVDPIVGALFLATSD